MRERIFHSLFHSPNVQNNYGQVGPEPGVKSFRVLASHTNGRDPNTWTICCWFPRHSYQQGPGLEEEQLGLKLVLRYGIITL